MNYFSIIPEGQAIINTKGVYRQVAIYQRASSINEGRKILYAKFGSGFIRLLQGGATSNPNVRWHEIDAAEHSYIEERGTVFLADPSVKSSRKIKGDAA